MRPTRWWSPAAANLGFGETAGAATETGRWRVLGNVVISKKFLRTRKIMVMA